MRARPAPTSSGLTSEEAEDRIRRHRPNEPATTRRQLMKAFPPERRRRCLASRVPCEACRTCPQARRSSAATAGPGGKSKIMEWNVLVMATSASRTRTPVLTSMMPAGSSYSMMDEDLAIARTTTMRCCSLPKSSAGKCRISSSSPTSASASGPGTGSSAVAL